jgi:dethiobiotin synthetase
VRPERVVVVAGTGTEVGKTFVGAAVAHALREQGHSVVARKPAQSNAPEDSASDALVLGSATGEAPETVCPKHRWYRVPMAPPMAAAVLGRDPFTVADLVFETNGSWPHDVVDVALVETAGGAWSPQASDGLHVGDFAQDLDADAVLLVADAGLGVINAVRGAAAAFVQQRPLIVFLNRYDDTNGVHVANLTWLAHHDKFTAVTSTAEAAAMLVAI